MVSNQLLGANPLRDDLDNEEQFLGLGKAARKNRQAKREAKIEKKKLKNDLKRVAAETKRADVERKKVETAALEKIANEPAPVEPPKSNKNLYMIIGAGVIAIVVVILVVILTKKKQS